MRSLIVASLLTSALALSACSPEAPGGGEAIPPADAPGDVLPAPGTAGEVLPTTATDPAEPFRADFVLIGTEPFWRLDIKGGALALTQPDQPAVTTGKATLEATSGKAMWSAAAGDKAMVAALTAKSCSDGMSDRTYPYVAEVKLGETVFKGCGISASEFAKLPPQ
jgi:uncharacterized membrane protein